MKWRRARRSDNIEDRRGQRAQMPIRLPGNLRLGRKTGGAGGLVVLAIFALAIFAGVDPATLLGGLQTGPSNTQVSRPAPANDEMTQFMAAVLGDTEDTWHPLFRNMGKTYEEPVLVLFNDRVASACGTQSAAVGPFYCPPDKKVFIDLGFFQELGTRFNAPGDFAQAYVLAHEVGHHVQNLLGISRQVRQAQARVSRAEANALSVRVELQADCFAGVWAHHADRMRGLVETGDFQEALRAATAVGDDALQRQATGTVRPESFTHGTAEQRARWFKRGVDAGNPSACDTFEVDRL
jgi:hypothetical protein